MAVKIRTVDNSFVKEIDADGITVGALLKKLGLLVEEYVVVKNNQVVTEDDIVRDGDEIVLYPVVSGG
ncbi:MoaD/ThiS family protein [Desulfurococcaceae archaeon MEX13E-LK6-19]|nr:MoaD/ThiS family protein [Desulfurococcaceae archaeon MEX13E-LK6-19]